MFCSACERNLVKCVPGAVARDWANKVPSHLCWISRPPMCPSYSLPPFSPKPPLLLSQVVSRRFFCLPKRHRHHSKGVQKSKLGCAWLYWYIWPGNVKYVLPMNQDAYIGALNISNKRSTLQTLRLTVPEANWMRHDHDRHQDHQHHHNHHHDDHHHIISNQIIPFHFISYNLYHGDPDEPFLQSLWGNGANLFIDFPLHVVCFPSTS